MQFTDQAPYEGLRIRFSNSPPVRNGFRVVRETNSRGEVRIRRIPQWDLPADGPQYDRNLVATRGTGAGTTRVTGPRTARAGEYRYVEIRDMNTPLNRSPSTPGVDLHSVRAFGETRTSRNIQRVSIQLDISGSMRRKYPGSSLRVLDAAERQIRRHLIPRDPAFAFNLEVRTFQGTKNSSGGRFISQSVKGNLNSAQARSELRRRTTEKTAGTGWTPLVSQLEDNAESIRSASEVNHLVVLITDGHGVVKDDKGKDTHVSENLGSINNPTTPSERRRNFRVNGKAANLELIGFRVPPKERNKLLEFEMPGIWRTSVHHVETTRELANILTGIKAKYGLE